MNNVLKSSKALLVIGLLAGCFSFVAWKNDKPFFQNPKPSSLYSDTNKPRKHSDVKDEYRIEELDKAMQQLDIEMKRMNEQLSKIDFNKIDTEIKLSLDKINVEQMQKDIQLSMQKIDWDKMQADVNKAIAEAKVNVEKINVQELDKQIEELKKMKLDLKINSEKINEEVKRSLADAKKSMEKAKEEIQNLKAFTDALEKDKLIDKKKGYRIKLNDGELFINGTKQSKQTFEKYKKYYYKDSFSISSDGESISTL